MLTAALVYVTLGVARLDAGQAEISNSYFGPSYYRESLHYVLQYYDEDDPIMPNWKSHDGSFYTSNTNFVFNGLPYHSSEEDPDMPGNWKHTHKHTRAGFTSGKRYQYLVYLRNGAPPNYNYTFIGSTEWTQP
jgi:hypothetical protein